MASRAARLVALAVCLSTASCSVVLQDGVRSSGLDCSPSRGYWIVDALFAISTAATAITLEAPVPVFIVPGLFVGSVFIGRYKRSNCVDLRRSTTPEQWEAHRKYKESVRALREAEAQRAEAEYEAQRQAQLQATREILEARKAELEAQQAVEDEAAPRSPPAEERPVSRPAPPTPAAPPPLPTSRRVGDVCRTDSGMDRTYPTDSPQCEHACYKGRCVWPCEDLATSKPDPSRCPASSRCQPVTDGKYSTYVCM